MKLKGLQDLNQKIALNNYVQGESVSLKNQIANLQAQLFEKDKIITSQKNTINQTNNQLSSVKLLLSNKDIELLNKNNEFATLQKEIVTYKQSIIDSGHSLNQKDNIIDLISKSIDGLRLEKQELKNDNKTLKNLLSFNEKKLKEKDLKLSMLQKPIDDFNGSDLDIEKILDPLKEIHIVQSIYPSEDIEKSDSKMVGEDSGFIIMEANEGL